MLLNRRRCVCVALLSLVLCPHLLLGDKELNELALKGEKVVIFKNGYCLIGKRATGTTDSKGLISTFEVPDAAILGSFWAVPINGNIESMTAGLVEEEVLQSKRKTCTETIELIQANAGSTCKLFMNDGSELSGVIGKVLGTESMIPGTSESPQQPYPHFSSGYHRSVQYYSPVENTQVTQSRLIGDKFLLSTDDGDVLLQASSIRRMVIRDMNTEIEQKTRRKRTRKRLQFQFKEKESAVEFMIMYFRPGARWIPTYRLDLTDESDEDTEQKLATLQLQGEIINEAEDLIDVPIDLVVGVPNFRFDKIPSPLNLEKVLRNALVEAAPELMGQGNGFMSNAMFQSRAGERGRGGGHGAGQSTLDDAMSLELANDLEAQGSQDLMIYQLGKMTLRKGERASLPIFTSKVPYKDVYTWRIQTKRDYYRNSNRQNNSPLKISQKKVWRQIQFANTSDLPLTTGVAMMVEGFQPLGQELLTYTPPGGVCRIPVTIAVDLVGKIDDFEVSREKNPKSDSKWNKFIVNNKIEIQLKNHKKRPIDIEVEVLFGGRVKKVSDDGRTKTSHFRMEDWNSFDGSNVHNASSQVIWTTTLESGETFQPTVDFWFYSHYE